MVERGDQNTTFYHAVVKQKGYIGKILALKNETGELLIGTKDIGEHVVQHFTNFFKGEPMTKAAYGK